jgi:heat-inducible transcriptional repressor
MLFSQQLFGGVAGEELVVDGEEQLLGMPEFSEAENFRKLLDALEEKTKLVRILERCREGEGVRIFIGADAEVQGFDSMALVSAPYFKDGNVIGTLGVIGPMRMDYSRVVPVVDFTAKVLGDALES